MDKLKSFALLVMAAVLGGVISLGIYRYNENGNINPFQKVPVQQTAYQYRTVDVPSFDFSDVADIVTPTVVYIKTTIAEHPVSQQQQVDPFDFFGNPFGMMPQQQGPVMASGSGVILSPDGYIVTNNHVVKDASKIEVVLNDKRSFIADVVGTDPSTDLAVIKINASDLTPIKFGNSNDVKVGQWVLAAGNPFNLTSTITAGIVSAKARSIQLLNGGSSIESFIQTDAAVNPGNSGGALVNTKGELVGINTAIASQTGNYAGYAFAIPSDIVEKVTSDLMKYGVIQRGMLGVQIKDVTSELLKSKNLDLDKPMGVYVDKVTDNSAAKAAGLKEGDVITKVEGHEVNSVPELQETVGILRPGDQIQVTVERKGEEKTFNVTLRNKDGKTGLVSDADAELRKDVGATFIPIPSDLQKKLKIQSGVQVKNIKGGYFGKSDVPEDFVITKMDNKAVFNSNDIYRILKDKTGAVMLEGYTPDGKQNYYILKLAK
jgi:Do/DeqQ family serine protease